MDTLLEEIDVLVEELNVAHHTTLGKHALLFTCMRGIAIRRLMLVAVLKGSQVGFSETQMPC